MPGPKDNLVALKLDKVMPLSSPKNIGPLIQDGPQPLKIFRGINKFYHSPVIGRLLRFFTWWFIISGIYASSSVCPFCGQMGCPVGAASAGMVGGFFALVVEKGEAISNRLDGWLIYVCALIKPLRGSRP
jgi:hypothetical protein